HLLEVNPRPGGGGNVAAIRRLSGVDLHEEFVRLWLGRAGPLPRAEPTARTLCYGVGYPSQKGFIEWIRPAGALEWTPLVTTGDPIDTDGGEQYLGVLIAPDLCESLAAADTAARELEQMTRSTVFVRERPAAP